MLGQHGRRADPQGRPEDHPAGRAEVRGPRTQALRNPGGLHGERHRSPRAGGSSGVRLSGVTPAWKYLGFQLQ